MSLELLIITSLWIYGMNFLIVDDRSIFSLDYETIEKIPSWLSKPLFKCVMCMASFHGTIFYWLFSPDPALQGWVAFCVALCGFNYLLNELIWTE